MLRTGRGIWPILLPGLLCAPRVVRNGAAAPCMRPVQMRLLGSINLFHTLDRTYAGPEGDRGRVCGPCV